MEDTLRLYKYYFLLKFSLIILALICRSCLPQLLLWCSHDDFYFPNSFYIYEMEFSREEELFLLFISLFIRLIISLYQYTHSIWVLFTGFILFWELKSKCYHYLFCYSNCSRFSHWELFKFFFLCSLDMSIFIFSFLTSFFPFA